jgi:DNA-binding MarR family transcriptional regulator
MAEIQMVRQLIVEASLLARLARSHLIAIGESAVLGEAERRVMRLLGEEGELTVPQLARASATTRQNLRVVVNRLAAKGLVKAVANPAHRKSPLILISEQGMARLARSEDSLESGFQGMIGKLDDDDLGTAIECLQRTRELLYGTAGPVPLKKAPEKEPPKETRTWKSAGAERKFSSAKEEPGSEENEAELPVNLL